MIHFLVAKLFFIFFSICLDAFATTEPSSAAAVSTPTIAPAIVCTKIGNTKYLQLNNSSSNSRLAIFSLREKWYIVWDLDEHTIADISLPPQEEWPAGFAFIKKASDIKTSKPCIILSFEVSAEMMPMVTKTEKGWAINIVSEYLLKDNPNPNQISFAHQSAGHFQILNADNTSFIKLNMPTGEELNITPTNHPDTGLDPSQYDYVDIHESVQGACLYFKSDQLFIEKQGDDAAYYPVSDPMMCSQAQLGNIHNLPPNIAFIKSGDFTSTFRNLLANKATYDKKNRSLHLLRQAWIELVLGEGNEATQTIMLLGKENPNFIKSLFYQVISGFGQFLSQDYKDCIKTLESLPNTSEINLWRNLARSQLNERVIFNENVADIIKNYPLNLRDYILARIVPYLFEYRQTKLLKVILQEIIPQAETTQAIMAFYSAMYVFTFEDKDKGYKLLLPIAKNETPYTIPNELQTEARLETYFYNNGDAKVDELISELDILRTQARGHDIEVKICLKLIEQLEKNKDYPRIIELIQDLLLRFKKFDVSLGLSQLLRNYLEKFFVTDNESASAVKTISLFVKYKAIIERYSLYETIAERVAHQYERLDLLDKAAELLTEIFQKTSKAEQKIEYQLRVGNIYVQNSKPEKAILLLSDIYPKIEEKYQKQAATILAKADCLKKDFNTAIKRLQNHPTKENLKVIIGIYIEKKDYCHVIASLKDYLAILTNEDSDDRERALVQLAATYHIQKNAEPLKELYEANKKFMQGRKSEKTFAMFCRPHAEHLQTTEEVYNYIHDGDILREILENSRVHR